MGAIRIDVQGSFGRHCTSKQFSAMERGHAQAVAEAIGFLSNTLLPEAISLDFMCANEGVQPSKGFGAQEIKLKGGAAL